MANKLVMKKKGIFLALALMFYITAVVFAGLNAYNKNEIFENIAFASCFVTIVFIFEYRITCIKEERDLYREGYIRELHRRLANLSIDDEEKEAYLYMN